MKEILQSRSVQLVLGFGVSGVLIAWMAFTIQWGEVLRYMSDVNYLVFFPVTLVFFLHHSLRSLRWRLLIQDGEGIGFQKLFEGIIIGNFANFILPLRAGEFVRPFMLSRQTDIQFGASFVSIVIERFFDLTTVLLLFGVTLLMLELPDWTVHGAIALGSIVVGIIIFITLGTFLPVQLMRIVDFFLRFFPEALAKPLRAFVSEFLRGAKVINSAPKFAKIILLTLAVWGSWIVFGYVSLALIDGPVTWELSLALTVIVALAVAAPSAPGFIGIYQTGCIAAFLACGSTQELAVAYAILSHLFQYVIYIALGIFILFKNNLSMRELQASSP